MEDEEEEEVEEEVQDKCEERKFVEKEMKTLRTKQSDEKDRDATICREWPVQLPPQFEGRY